MTHNQELMVKLLILGATGLVGMNVFRKALEDKRFSQVIAPSRRSLPTHRKLVNPVSSDLATLLPDATDWAVDAVICAMGTTIGKAGSKEAFRHVDYVLPLAFAKRAHQRGGQAFALVSSPGASMSVPLFYCRTKAELERDIDALGFRSLTIVRPGMIGGHRQEFRPAERIVFPLAGILRPILPKGLWINPAASIADVLIESVVAGRPGRHMVTSRDIVERAHKR